MEINQDFIYNSFLLNNQRINELLKQAEELTTLNINYFMGCMQSKQGTTNKNALVSLNKGDIMKFQGKTIFKNKKCSTWYTRYRINGKQFYISGKSQKEVLAILKNRLNYKTREKEKYTTLLDWYKQWLELFKVGKVKQSTLAVYNGLIKHIPEDLQNKDIKTINSLDIQKLINTTQGERTKQKLYELLKDIFTKGENNNICQNILKNIDKPKHTKENGIALTTQDRLKFEDYCLKNKEYIFLITLYQGLRKGEVLGITWDNIDYTNNLLTINKNYNLHGKFDTTKNITSNRTMPLFDISKKVLQKLTIEQDERVFKLCHNTMQDKFKNIINKLALNSRYTIHSLRHTFITNCQDQQIPEHIIQNWVGHQIGSNVTKKIYTHIQEDTNNQFIAQLNKSKFYSNSTRE